MTKDERLPLLRVRPEDVAPAVLVVGDPARAERAASILTGAERVAANREYATYTGSFGGRRLTICSHGVGCAGAGVCFEELARAGARTILRAGSCGALRDEIADGELIVATAAVRDDGLTPRLVPAAFPAVADLDLTLALRAAAESRGEAVRTGIVLTSDLFYPSRVLGQDFSEWQAAGVLAVEMELAALYVIAALHGIRAGGLLVVDGNPSKAAVDMSEYDPYRPVVAEGVDRMLRLSLEVLASFAPEPE